MGFFQTSIDEFKSIQQLGTISMDQLYHTVDVTRQDMKDAADAQFTKEEWIVGIQTTVNVIAPFLQVCFPVNFFVDIAVLPAANFVGDALANSCEAALHEMQMNVTQMETYAERLFPSQSTLGPASKYLAAHKANGKFYQHLMVPTDQILLHRSAVQAMMTNAQSLHTCTHDSLSPKCIKETMLKTLLALHSTSTSAVIPVQINSPFYECVIKIMGARANGDILSSSKPFEDAFNTLVYAQQNNPLIGVMDIQQYLYYSTIVLAIPVLSSTYRSNKLFRIRKASRLGPQAQIRYHQNRAVFPEWEIRPRFQHEWEMWRVENVKTLGGEYLDEDGRLIRIQEHPDWEDDLQFDEKMSGLEQAERDLGPTRNELRNMRVARVLMFGVSALTAGLGAMHLWNIEHAHKNFTDYLSNVSATIKNNWDTFYRNITYDQTPGAPCPSNGNIDMGISNGFTRDGFAVASLHRGGLCVAKEGAYPIHHRCHDADACVQDCHGTYHPAGAPAYCECDQETSICKHCCRKVLDYYHNVMTIERAAPSTPMEEADGKQTLQCDYCTISGYGKDECNCGVCGSSPEKRSFKINGATINVDGCSSEAPRQGDGWSLDVGSCHPFLQTLANVPTSFKVYPCDQMRTASIGENICDPSVVTRVQAIGCDALSPADGGGAQCQFGSKPQVLNGIWTCVEYSSCVPDGGNSCDSSTYGFGGFSCGQYPPPVGGANCCPGFAPILEDGVYRCRAS